MKGNVLYRDSLIIIKDDTIILKNYYFPLISSKRILFSDIEIIETNKPSLGTGRWRIWGRIGFIIWFPFDLLRPIRKKIFVISYKSNQIKSGFTVKDSNKVEQILKEKGLLN